MSVESRTTPDAVRANFKHDIPAGIAIFLVALPLCLGIALASGAPLFAGIIAGAVGGMVVSLLSGSQVSVSGPAAGLAIIASGAIRDIGSYQGFLTAVVLSGVIQFGFGVLRLGTLADYVPNSVIKGMLAGIGIVIVLKQIPHALGRDRDYEGDFSFLEPGGSNTLSDIAEGIASASPGAIVISLACLALLLSWDWIASRQRLFRMMPGPLPAVLLGTGLNQLFAMAGNGLALVDPEHLVNLPVAANAAEFLGQFTFPDFAFVTNKAVWLAASTIALVGSVESLLSLEAADRLDPFKRISPPNRELRAQGLGNLISGLLGGLPVTSVVLRTSANVYAGGRTWVSAFLQGSLLLVAVMLVPGILKLVPLACLASILIVIGLRLTPVSLYRSMYSLGIDQFVPFVVTVVAVVFTDLLVGVLTGLAFGAFFVMRTNHHDAITVVSDGKDYMMRFNKDASFLNKSELRSKLRQLPEHSHLIIDGTRALFIDHDILEVVDDFRELARHRHIQVEFRHWEIAS